MSDEDLPAALGRLWGAAGTSRRGRPAGLDLGRILQVAVELADAHGLAGVSLPKLAKALGYTPMSLYRYVGSKDELVLLMQDVGSGPPPEIRTAPEEWREGLRRWANADRRLNHRRPWLAQIPVSGPPAGPNGVGWMEAALHVLRGTGLDWPEKLGAMMLVNGYVRNATLLYQGQESGQDRTGLDAAEVERQYGRALPRMIDPDTFPQMTALLASGVFEDTTQPPSDDPVTHPDFTFGLERILDGIAVTVDTHRRPDC